MRHSCPVCVFPDLPYPPRDYHICPCCGTEFGNDDSRFSHAQLREMWIAGGAQWFFGKPPQPWNPWLQLIQGGFRVDVPQYETRFTTTASITAVPGFSVPDAPFILTGA
jgi:hypothetical protein